jgi:hypothetical protein
MTDPAEHQFPDLSAEEQAIVGSPADYDWDGATTSPARVRPDMTQFSLRIEREVYNALQALADQEGLRLSDVARAALREFAIGGSNMTRPDIIVSLGNTRMLVQVKSHTVVSAQFPANRRSQLPDERVPLGGNPLPTIASAD